jgi:hypothetical protein
MCSRADGVWFLVRRGEPFKREESLEGEEASSVCYRPLKYDVLVYQPAIGELRINARSKGEKQLYRAQFGRLLFGDKAFFPGTEKYALDPLRVAGEASLSCAYIDGMEWVKLNGAQFFFAGTPWEVVSRKSDDLFALMKARGKALPEGGRLIRATFQIKFTDSRTPRTLVLRPSNIAQYTRDDDSVLVEAWLALADSSSHRGWTNMSGAVRFWQAVESITTHAAVGAEWRSLLGDDFELLRPLFRPRAALAESYPCVSEHGVGLPSRVVQHGPEDFVAVCTDSGESMPLRRADLVVYELDLRLLAVRVAEALDIEQASSQADWDGQTVCLGHYRTAKGVGFTTYLTVPTRRLICR